LFYIIASAKLFLIIKKIVFIFIERQGGFQMAQHTSLQETIKAIEEKIDVGGMINKALIGILIAKDIISEEEMVTILGKINSQQEILLGATK
jgi:hypothetical protein